MGFGRGRHLGVAHPLRWWLLAAAWLGTKIVQAQSVGTNVVRFGCFTTGAFAGTAGTWSVTAGNVDQLGPGSNYESVPQCSCGYTIDMAGSTPGTIQQTIATSNGNLYNVSYQLSGNYNGGFQGTFVLRFTWGSWTWDETYTRPAGWTTLNLQYSMRYRIVNATGATTTFRLQDLSGGSNAGMIITDVRGYDLGLNNVTNAEVQARAPLTEGCPPTSAPTQVPTQRPTTARPTLVPSFSPTQRPTTGQPTLIPTNIPTQTPTTAQPTQLPSQTPSSSPSQNPSLSPTFGPSGSPSAMPTQSPSISPSSKPGDTSSPTKAPTPQPTVPGEVPPGPDVLVPIFDSTTTVDRVGELTFSSVTAAGIATAVPISPSSPSLACDISGQPLGTPGILFDISTTAVYTGTIGVCLNYPADSFPLPYFKNPRLLHCEDNTNAWSDITQSADTINNIVCGDTTSLSPFAVIFSNDFPSSSSNDPHLVGATGTKYDFDGQPDGTYNLFSAPQFQLVMTLSGSDGPGTRFMTEIGLLFRNQSFHFDAITMSEAFRDDLGERLAQVGGRLVDWSSWQARIELCAGQTVTITQMHTVKPWLAHADGSPWSYLDVDLSLRDCHDDYDGALGQTYRCKYLRGEEDFHWSHAQEESFRLPGLFTPTGSFQADAGCFVD